MNPLLLYVGYFEWHYGRALVSYFRVWGNILWFIVHFFSTPSLITSIFSPWRRLHEEYKKGLYIAEFFSTLTVNILMRIVGALIRLVFITISFVALILTVIIGSLFFVFWLIAPFALVAMLILGVMFIL